MIVAVSPLENFLEEKYSGTVTVRSPKCFDCKVTEELFCKNFDILSPENIGIEQGSVLQSVLGAVIDYLHENGKTGTIAIKNVNVYIDNKFKIMDLAVNDGIIVDKMDIPSVDVYDFRTSYHFNG